MGEGESGPQAGARKRLRLYGTYIRLLRGGPRRPVLPGRPGHYRRHRLPGRAARDGNRGAQGEGRQRVPEAQLRHAHAGGVPQGPAADEAGREVQPTHRQLRQYLRCLLRRGGRGERPGGGHRPEPAGNGRFEGAGAVHLHRRGRQRRRFGHSRGE